MLEKLEEKVKKMPLPEVIKVPSSRALLTLNESLPLALTISWQWTLAEISKALIAKNALKVLKLLFSELDYVQLNRNAVEDIRSVVREPVDENVLRETAAKIDSLKQLMSAYLDNPQLDWLQLNYLIDESSFVVQQLKSLDIVGVGAFMLASGFRLALLLEQAALDRTVWSQIKSTAIEDSDYAFSITPKLFRLSVGQIDKACQCTKWESAPELGESIAQYECRYFDGKNIQIFAGSRSDALFECNKHRLLMFQTVASSVNQDAAKPVRAAVKKWLELAASIKKNPTTDELAGRVVSQITS